MSLARSRPSHRKPLPVHHTGVTHWNDLQCFAIRPNGVQPLRLNICNPPTQVEVEAVRDKVNELLAALLP